MLVICGFFNNLLVGDGGGSGAVPIIKVGGDARPTRAARRKNLVA
jgi:hypothetical protein